MTDKAEAIERELEEMRMKLNSKEKEAHSRHFSDDSLND